MHLCYRAAPMAGAEYQFVAWARTGVGAVLGGAAGDLRLRLGAAGDVSRSIAAAGPGDVTDLDARAIVRTVPSNGLRDLRPTQRLACRLAHPSLPDGCSVLLPMTQEGDPWLVLVVTSGAAGHHLDPRLGGPDLLTHSISRIAGERAAGPHASLGLGARSVHRRGERATRQRRVRTLRRGSAHLIAPRRLDSGSSYLACIVPAFANGAAAALV